MVEDGASRVDHRAQGQTDGLLTVRTKAVSPNPAIHSTGASVRLSPADTAGVDALLREQGRRR